jgi:hypothetical protein
MTLEQTNNLAVRIRSILSEFNDDNNAVELLVRGLVELKRTRLAGIDLAAVREVIAGLRTNADDLDRIDVCPMLATHLRNGADKLEAAIKGVA